MSKILKKILFFPLFTSITCVGFFFYANSLIDVNPITIAYYRALKTELKNAGYQPSLWVISVKRAKWHNQLLTYFSTTSKSQHLKGNVIDILVIDLKNDAHYNQKDVDIDKLILRKSSIAKAE